MRPFLLVLCGLPSSGKTTFARALHVQLSKSARVELVCTDDLRTSEYYRDFRPELEHGVREDSLKYAESLIGLGVSVIFDDTNYYASMRHELLEIARQAHVDFGLIHISTPLDIALIWNEKRSGPISSFVIKRIAQRFDQPGRRYLWDIPLLEIDLSQRTIETAVALVIGRMGELSTPSDTRMVETSFSPPDNYSLYDVITRRVITAYLSDHPEKRGRPSITKIRHEALRQAVNGGLSAEDTERLLYEMLKSEE